MNWSVDKFIDCYNCIKYQGYLESGLLKAIKKDLIHVLNTPPRSEGSRNRLIDESSPVRFSDGAEFRLNRSFIESAILFATELNIDEIVAAEILFYSSEIGHDKGTGFTDSGRLAFFSRYEYILNILGYVISNQSLDSIVETATEEQEFWQNFILSFQKLYQMLDTLNDLIDKQRVANDINNLGFINSISYTKSQIHNDHEVLGQLLFSLVDIYPNKFGLLDVYNQVVRLTKSHLHPNDILLVHFLPGLLRIITGMANLTDKEVARFHQQVKTSLDTEYAKAASDNSIDLSKITLSGLEILLNFMMLTCFIPWCKESDQRLNKYDFKEDILKYIEISITFNAMDVLLCFSADTTNNLTSALLDWSNLYDFRSLLQVNFPRLKPTKFIYTNHEDLENFYKNYPHNFSNVPKLLDVSIFKLSESFKNDLVAPLLHIFFNEFIGNAAIILTLLRDTEEDFLLSSVNKRSSKNENDEVNNIRRINNRVTTGKDDSLDSFKEDEFGLDLDEIATKSDLERFYLAFLYTYNDRKDLCSLFWSRDDTTNDIIGFISWGLSNNTSPLITATFCLLLGSLTSKGEVGAVRIWEILVNNISSSSSGGFKKSDFSRISIDSIIDSLIYYVDSLNENFQHDLNLQMKLQQKRQEFLFSPSLSYDSQNKSETEGLNNVLIELSEDSVVFISGFIQLISSIVKNLSFSSERANSIIPIAFKRFSPIIRSFLKFDNIVMATKFIHNRNANNASSDSTPVRNSNHPQIIVSEENRVVLINLFLNLLSDFAKHDEDLNLRYQIWDLLDSWVCQVLAEEDSNTESSTMGYMNHSFNFLSELKSQSRLKIQRKGNVKVLEGLQTGLSHFSQVANFSKLMNHLLSPIKTESQGDFSSYNLLYPPGLGLGYRNKSLGTWPYMEYLILEVFAKSANLPNLEDKLNLQLILIDLIEKSLSEVDWVFINDTALSVVKGVNSLNSIVEPSFTGEALGYKHFVKLHHSLAVLNFLFDEKAYSVIFSILSMGNDACNANSQVGSLVDKTLHVLEKVLEIQDTFIHRLLPIIKGENLEDTALQRTALQSAGLSLAYKNSSTIFDNIHYPKSLGTNGVTDFYEVLLFNLSTVVHFGMYVGASDTSIADRAILILNKVSRSPSFVSGLKSSEDPLLNKNRLLLIFESVDDSVKIQFSFIQQMERSIENHEDIQVKFNILQFLIDNLENYPRDLNVAHFLLGYEIRGDNLIFDAHESHNTLLKSLILSLSSSLELISEVDHNNGNAQIIGIAPAKLSSMILCILNKLCSQSVSSTTTLNFLRTFEVDKKDLFSKMINSQPRIDLTTYFVENLFDGDLRSEGNNKFIEEQMSPIALLSFINQRTYLLQYLSLEFHSISQQRSITKKESYTSLLLNGNGFLNGSPQILNFLDILNFKFFNFEASVYEDFKEKYNLPLILEHMRTDAGLKEKLYDSSILEKAFNFISVNAMSQPEDKKFMEIGINDAAADKLRIAEYLNSYIISSELRSSQLSCLHAWTQLIQVLVSEGEFATSKKMDLILEIFQVILPKVNDYFEENIHFSKELISLCVFLFDLYEQDSSKETPSENKVSLYIERLNFLFKTCLNGIMCSNSTPDLRSDLYVLTNKFLQKSFNDSAILKQLVVIVRLIDSKLINIISNDSIYAEDTTKITSLLLLESLVHLSSCSQSHFILDLIMKNNLLLLLISSIKRTDEMISLYGDSEMMQESIETILYELTAFKSTICFLTRVAQTRLGAQLLIQHELFSIIKNCKFLSVDPDIGLSFKIGQRKDDLLKIHLTLDTPLSLVELNRPFETDGDRKISLFEFLVPVFQLVTAVLLSMGPSYKPSLYQAKDLLSHFKTLIVGILKRDTLLEDNHIQSKEYEKSGVSYIGLKEMVKLIVLLDSLVNYEQERKH